MSTDDYLTRHFQQLGKVIAALMGFREKKKYQLALEEINRVLETWFDLTESQIEQLPADEFCILLLKNHSVNFEKEKSIAELLYQKAKTNTDMDQKAKAITNALKALSVFKAIDQKSGEFSIEIQQRIAELDKISSGDG